MRRHCLTPTPRPTLPTRGRERTDALVGSDRTGHANMGLIERLTADVTCLRGALRTLKMTTPIAKNPTRVFPQVISGARGQVRRRAGAALRPRALQLPRARRALQPLRPLGAGAGRQEGRHGLPDDAGAAGVPGAVGRRHPRRRRGGAPQHQSDRDGAGALHQRREPEAHHRRRRIVRSPGRPRARTSPAMRRSGCTAMPTPISRASIARSMRCPATSSRRPTAARSPSRIARSISIRRARPACPRPPT